METTAIAVYQFDLPIAEGSYESSGDNSYGAFNSTIVRLETDAELAGWDEITMLGSAYLPAYARGSRAGIEKLTPILLGVDPTQPAVLADRIDWSLRGHLYAKSILGVACWDLAGEAASVAVSTLLGARFGEDVPFYRAVSNDTPEAMAASVATNRDTGYENAQLKIGENPVADTERIEATWAESNDECVTQSTLADARLASTDLQSYNTVTTADGAPETADDRMCAPTAPSLSVEPHLDVLGEPVATHGGEA